MPGAKPCAGHRHHVLQSVNRLSHLPGSDPTLYPGVPSNCLQTIGEIAFKRRHLPCPIPKIELHFKPVDDRSSRHGTARKDNIPPSADKLSTLPWRGLVPRPSDTRV